MNKEKTCSFCDKKEEEAGPIVTAITVNFCVQCIAKIMDALQDNNIASCLDVIDQLLGNAFINTTTADLADSTCPHSTMGNVIAEKLRKQADRKKLRKKLTVELQDVRQEMSLLSDKESTLATELRELIVGCDE